MYASVAASSVNCLVPISKLYLCKPSDNNELEPNTGALMVTNAKTMREWKCRKEIPLFLPLDRVRRQQRIQKTGFL